MNSAIISQIISISAGVGTAGVAGVYVIAPYLLGIYYDVEIYAHESSLTPIQHSSLPTTDLSDQAPKQPNPKNFACYLFADTTEHFDCMVSSVAIKSTASKLVNLGGHSTKIENIPDIKPDEHYYKITVSERLLWKLQSSTEKTVVIAGKNDDDSVNRTPVKNVYAFLYSFSPGTASWINPPKNAVQYYLGTAAKLSVDEIPFDKSTDSSAKPATSHTPVESIKQAGSSGYECSYSPNGTMTKCSVFDFNTASTDGSSANTFTKTTSESSEIKDGQHYLVTGTQEGKMFYVRPTGGTNKHELIKIQESHPAFIAEKNTSDVFIFSFSKLL